MHQRLLAYREAARHLWNTCFQPRVPTDDVGQLLDVFDRVRSLLFQSMTSHRLEAGSASQRPLPIEVPRAPAQRDPRQPRTHAGRPLGSPRGRRRCGRRPRQFVDFFDWDDLGPRDLAFRRRRITTFPAQPELIGKGDPRNRAAVTAPPKLLRREESAIAGCRRDAGSQPRW